MVDLARLAEDAAKGAAAGSIVPGFGTALGAAGAVVLDIAPEIGRWIFGSNGAAVGEAVAGAVAAVTGTADPGAQLAALEDPAKASDLRVKLAAIAASAAAAEMEASRAAMMAQLADTANARANTAQLAAQHSPIAWGAPVVSVIVLVTFGTVMAMVLFRKIPEGSDVVLNVLLGTLGAMATSVVSYWVGSSAGSAAKDVRLAKMDK